MKTSPLKITVLAVSFALAISGCDSSSGGKNLDQTAGDTTQTNSANPQIDGTDTQMTDTSATKTAPGGGVGKDGAGSAPDTASRSSH